MSIFGWSYPPGAAGDPYAPYNAQEGPCEVCGRAVDDCICPECPECGAAGDPYCYDHGHGARGYQPVTCGETQLQRNEAQIIGLSLRDEAQAAALAAEAAYWREVERP